MFKTTRRRGRRRAIVRAALALGVAAAAGGLAKDFRARRRSGDAERRQPWACECGEAYLVSGRDRHRVYWLPGAAAADPLLDRNCVSCGEPLPAEHTAAG